MDDIVLRILNLIENETRILLYGLWLHYSSLRL